MVFDIPVANAMKVEDVSETVNKLLESYHQDHKTQVMLIANVKNSNLTVRFSDKQSCNDIDQANEDTLVYEIRPPPAEEMKDFVLIQLQLMKLTKYGKSISGETLARVVPRLEYLNLDMTVLDIKKMIFEKVSHIYKKGSKQFEDDSLLNQNILLHIVDNLPFERYGKYSSKKAVCEFCNSPHG